MGQFNRNFSFQNFKQCLGEHKTIRVYRYTVCLHCYLHVSVRHTVSKISENVLGITSNIVNTRNIIDSKREQVSWSFLIFQNNLQETWSVYKLAVYFRTNPDRDMLSGRENHQQEKCFPVGNYSWKKWCYVPTYRY